MVSLELYNLNISTCSQKARLCLAEKGLPYVDRQVNLAAGEHLTPAYLALNPNGVVPTLLVDGAPVIDSSVICEFLDESFPDSPLAPSTPLGKAHMRAWMRYLEEVPTAAIRVPSLNALYANMFPGSEAEFQAFAARRPLRADFYREMGVAGFTESKVNASVERLRQTVERADSAIARDGPWLCGDMYTIADIMLIPTVVRMDDLGMAGIWSAFPHFAGWYGRIQARPSFAQAYKPGSRLTEEVLARVRSGVKVG